MVRYVQQVQLLLLAASVGGCTLLVDRSRFEETATSGVGGSGTASVTTTATTTTSGTGASSSATGGAGGTGMCLPSIFHVTFDEPTTDSWYGSVLTGQGSGKSGLVSTPTRSGAGAWRIDLTTQASSTLRTTAVDDDEEVWFGFSQLYEEPATAQGTSILSIACGAPAPTYVENLFVLQVDETSPGSPFNMWAPGAKNTPPSLDELGTIQAPAGFADWAVHLDLSKTPNGLVEVYFGGVLKYRLSGPNLLADCLKSSLIDTGMVRWGTPKPWALVEDELRLMRAPTPPLTDADALFTLAPGNCP